MNFKGHSQKYLFFKKNADLIYKFLKFNMI